MVEDVTYTHTYVLFDMAHFRTVGFFFNYWIPPLHSDTIKKSPFTI